MAGGYKDPDKQREYMRAWRKRKKQDPEYMRVRRIDGRRRDAHAAERIRRRAIIDALKSTAGCKVCGETHPAALSFHHRDPGTKRFDARAYNNPNYRWDVILAEFEKCDILCENCHRKLHWAERNARSPT